MVPDSCPRRTRRPVAAVHGDVLGVVDRKSASRRRSPCRPSDQRRPPPRARGRCRRRGVGAGPAQRARRTRRPRVEPFPRSTVRVRVPGRRRAPSQSAWNIVNVSAPASLPVTLIQRCWHVAVTRAVSERGAVEREGVDRSAEDGSPSEPGRRVVGPDGDTSSSFAASPVETCTCARRTPGWRSRPAKPWVVTTVTAAAIEAERPRPLSFLAGAHTHALLLSVAHATVPDRYIHVSGPARGPGPEPISRPRTSQTSEPVLVERSCSIVPPPLEPGRKAPGISESQPV